MVKIIEKIKKKIKTFIKFIDLFAVPFSFRYKNENTYSTLLGGIFSLIFSLVSVGFGIYYFIPFCQRKNFSINFYTISLPHTEQIRLHNSSLQNSSSMKSMKFFYPYKSL